MQKKIYTCKHCGEQFDALWKYGKHSSEKHSSKLSEYRKQKRETKYNKYMENPNTCKQCGKIIQYSINAKKRKFCDKSCAAIWNNAHIYRKWNGGRKKVTSHKHRVCKVCGTIKTNKSKSKYCSLQCWIVDNNKRTIKKWLSATKSPSWSFCNRPVIRKYILEDQGMKCDICGTDPVWRGKPLLFIMDHIDGNTENNFRENLRLICSNCDSQLPTYKKKKYQKKVNKKKKDMVNFINEYLEEKT